MSREPGPKSPQWTEPLLLIDGAAGDEVAGGEPERRRGSWRRRLRPYRDLGLLVAVVAVAVVLARDADPAAPVSATATVTTTVQPRRAPDPRLVAPATVEPGATVSIVAYRPRGLCGDIELRLDDARLDHRVTATIEAPLPNWNAVLLTVRIPVVSPADVHELELVGPVPGAGRGGVRCGDRDQRHGTIATASIVVSSARE